MTIIYNVALIKIKILLQNDPGADDPGYWNSGLSSFDDITVSISL